MNPPPRAAFWHVSFTNPPPRAAFWLWRVLLKMMIAKMKLLKWIDLNSVGEELSQCWPQREELE